MNQGSMPYSGGQGMPGMPGSVPPSPMGGVPPQPPTPPGGGMLGEDPHEKIMATLSRIEEKLAAIAAKVGA